MTEQPEAQRLEELKQRMRDPNPAAWQEACRGLASLALEHYGAYEEMRRLVACPHAELRLRGVYALSCLAVERPLEVRDFFVECLAEADVGTDPVFADALLALLAHLPPELASPLLEKAAVDARDVVRAAAAGVLATVRGWRPGLLYGLAGDASPDVRCAVALSAHSLGDDAEAAQALALVAASPEAYVRDFVAEINSVAASHGLQSGVERTGEADTDALVAGRGAIDPLAVSNRLGGLLDRPGCSADLVARVDEVFAAQPHLVAEIVYPLLQLPGLPSLLDQLAWSARDATVAELCRALLATCRPDLGRGEVHLRKLLQTLAGQSGAQAEAFRGWVGECARGATASSAADIVRWAGSVDPARYGPLIDFATALAACDDLAGLHVLAGSLDETQQAIEATYALPELALVRMVVECWSEALDQEMQDQAYEGSS